MITSSKYSKDSKEKKRREDLGGVSDCLCKGFPLTRAKPRSFISQDSALGCKHENCKQREEVTTDHKGLVSRTATKR